MGTTPCPFGAAILKPRDANEAVLPVVSVGRTVAAPPEERGREQVVVGPTAWAPS